MAGVRADNPFSPTFGTTPPLLAGRDEVLTRFSDALDAGPTHPDYTLLITGEPGTGKTALLNALEAKAADRGWMTVTAAPSSEPVSARVASEARRCMERLRGGRRGTRLGSVSALGVGISLEPRQPPAEPESGLLSVLEDLGELLHERGTGVLLTVDELHDMDRDDVRNVASGVQIVTRRRLRPVAFAATALPPHRAHSPERRQHDVPAALRPRPARTARSRRDARRAAPAHSRPRQHHRRRRPSRGGGRGRG